MNPWIRGIAELSAPLRHTVVTIGNFDGVHIGHREIFRQAIEKARARNGHAVVYTFRPHPQAALRPSRAPPLLLTYEEKREEIAGLGIDLIVEEPFSREFSTVSSEVFFRDILRARLGAECLVVGYDFAFGKERQGSLETLGAMCARDGVELCVVPPFKLGEEVVSSSRVRRALLEGDLPLANGMLGSDFFYRGIVVRGEGRGRKLGVPTANLKLEPKLALPNGVYATRTLVDGRVRPSVTNIGVRPTFHSGDPGFGDFPALVENHVILDALPGASAGPSAAPFAAPSVAMTPESPGWIDLYGKQLDIRFVKRLRSERKFSGVSELTAQIAEDIRQSREVLARS